MDFQEILQRMQASQGNLWRAGLASSTAQPGYTQVPGTGEGENNPAVYAPDEAVQLMNSPQTAGAFGTYIPGVSGDPFGAHEAWNDSLAGKLAVGTIAAVGGAAAGGYGAGEAAAGGVGATEAGAAGGAGAGTGASAGLPAITEGGGAVSGSTLAGGAGATVPALEAGGGGAGGSAGTGALEGGGTSPVNAGPGGATDVGASPFDNIDYGALLRGLPGAIGAIGAHQQTQAYRDLANRYLAMGQPYRDRLAALYADPTSFLHSAEVTTPVQQGTDALARSLSIQGNPIGSGHALQELQNYSANQLFGRLGEERNRLAGFGGLASYNAAAPGAAGNVIGSQGNIWNAVGSGVGAVVNPQPTLIDLYRSMQGLQ